jgi:hypothetical protein
LPRGTVGIIGSFFSTAFSTSIAIDDTLLDEDNNASRMEVKKKQAPKKAVNFVKKLQCL